MSTSITNGTFFMQSQDGEWVKIGEPVEMPELVNTAECNGVSLNVRPMEFTGTFDISGNYQFARIRRKLLGFKGHPRMRNLLKAARIVNVASGIQ